MKYISEVNSVYILLVGIIKIEEIKIIDYNFGELKSIHVVSNLAIGTKVLKFEILSFLKFKSFESLNFISKKVVMRTTI